MKRCEKINKDRNIKISSFILFFFCFILFIYVVFRLTQKVVKQESRKSALFFSLKLCTVLFFF